ncbi:hypothetical protein IAQ61_000729 [Plenodomus lingam]|nr:hypothetical protein IAQ61_000729 [Plenodomus lingam]
MSSSRSPKRPASPRKPTKHSKPFSAFAEELGTHYTAETTDRQDVHHAGAMGLFDDPDEIEAEERRRVRHELERHQARVRQMQRHDKKDSKREMKETKRIAQ